jgi:small-conductance mechanosensitive channel
MNELTRLGQAVRGRRLPHRQRPVRPRRRGDDALDADAHAEQHLVIIPTKHIIDTVVINHTKHGETRVNVPIGIAYKERIPEAKRVLLAAATGIDGVIGSPAPDVVVAALDEADIEFPFPHLQLFLEDVEKRALQKVADFAQLFMRSTPAADGDRVPRRPSGES